MKDLRAINLELEAVTPLWIGGADRQPELRPPAVRGCLRFWLRALLGGTLGEDLALLRKAEAAVFGDTQRASRVVVRMSGQPQIGPTPVSTEDFPGAAYLLWSVLQRDRSAILPGETFRLRLQCRSPALAAVEVDGRSIGLEDGFELAAAALWLLLRLGGIGARGRRGGGRVQARQDPEGWPADLPPLPCRAQTPAELATELGAGIRQIRKKVGWQNAVPGPVSSFDILHPEITRICVIEQRFASWCEALDWAGRRFQAFRSEQKDDAGAIAALLTRGRLAARTLQRAVLGLPILFFFKSIFNELTSRGISPKEARQRASASVTPQRGLGRTSPLFFHVVRLAGEPPSYAVVMGLFRAELLPEGRISIRPQDRSVRPAGASVPADYALVDGWFDHVAQEAGALHAVRIGE